MKERVQPILEKNSSFMCPRFFLFGILPEPAIGGSVEVVWIRISESVASRLECPADSKPSLVGSMTGTVPVTGTKLLGSLKAWEIRRTIAIIKRVQFSILPASASSTRRISARPGKGLIMIVIAGFTLMSWTRRLGPGPNFEMVSPRIGSNWCASDCPDHHLFHGRTRHP